MIRIHREDLVAAKACAKGIEWFDTHFPSGVAKFESTKELLLFACSTRGAAYAEWWTLHARVTYDLSDADMRGAELRGADLAGSNLRGAKLQNATLRGADLRGAILRYADMRAADLIGACLQGADLRSAELTGAVLTDADLIGSQRLDTDPPIPGWVLRDGGLSRIEPTEAETKIDDLQ